MVTNRAAHSCVNIGLYGSSKAVVRLGVNVGLYGLGNIPLNLYPAHEEIERIEPIVEGRHDADRFTVTH